MGTPKNNSVITTRELLVERAGDTNLAKASLKGSSTGVAGGKVRHCRTRGTCTGFHKHAFTSEIHEHTGAVTAALGVDIIGELAAAGSRPSTCPQLFQSSAEDD